MSSMKIALVGGSGAVGSRIANEALRRGHEVTAVVRDPARVGPRAHLTPVAGDAHDPSALAGVLAGHDVVVSAVRVAQVAPAELIDAVRGSGVKRYLVVGGAGSLEVAPGRILVDSPHFPAEHRGEALGGKKFLDALRGVHDLDWTFLSPSALFTAGERTGSFRLGGDELLTGADGKSWISFEDYAIAMLDEIERPAHVRRRFTVGY
jgi:putative NADH-flavin reductase